MMLWSSMIYGMSDSMSTCSTSAAGDDVASLNEVSEYDDVITQALQEQMKNARDSELFQKGIDDKLKQVFQTAHEMKDAELLRNDVQDALAKSCEEVV